MDRSGSGRVDLAMLAIAVCGLLGGLAFRLAGQPGPADIAWTAGVLPSLAVLLADILRGLLRRGTGLDIIAALSMTAALVFGETLAAAVVAVMYAGGTFLESFAEGRARREMHALLARVPRTATRCRGDRLEDVPLEAIEPGDRLLIRRGDVLPVDGTVTGGAALLDTSALTGEALPVRVDPGTEALSGATNAGEAFSLCALRRARESTYAGIVRLVEEARSSKAPMSRLADRWSLWFLALTCTLAGAAWWATGDPLRAVAVLVVATPCPLILAVPVALVAGLSCAARFGVLVKGAGPLERMGRVRTVILDKTGTLTEGRPQIVSVTCEAGVGPAEVLRLAAALDQATGHPVARAIVAAARARGLALPAPTGVEETAGEGVRGQVEGRAVVVGGTGFVASQIGVPEGALPGRAAGSVLVAVAADGRRIGHLTMSDPLRSDARQMLQRLRRGGVQRILLATGDRAEVAGRITAGLGLDAVRAELTPGQKVGLVRAERAAGPVMMVGDGVNDAPALAAADVGVAMGARGAAASAEAADIVLLVDRLDRLATGIDIARRARRIALQCVVAGIGLSAAGMMAAALGHLTPVQGALLQEAIDLAVILNALRALRPATGRAPADTPAAA
ncbi:heavy metal translocating P-type ATPase [Oceanicella sp. SM1341]|uniref:heavy metal translocating P-type ATPase n=1 Tax=Oceanicella sp. SM1341 TaxID=1548889 RepID=UPI000E5237D1|nr:heavy metal translocating P-type ATPase [Oceanicella sp. SM1341]